MSSAIRLRVAGLFPVFMFRSLSQNCSAPGRGCLRLREIQRSLSIVGPALHSRLAAVVAILPGLEFSDEFGARGLGPIGNAGAITGRKARLQMHRIDVKPG